MRNFLFAFSISFAFSLSWGFTSKNKSQKAVLPKSSERVQLNESRANMAIRGDSYETQFSKANVFQLKFNYFLKYHVNPNFYTKVNPIARLYSGHVQSVDGQEKMVNSIAIQNAAVYGQWMKESYAAAGILDQYDVFSGLVIDDRMAFIGGQGKQSIVTGPWTFSLLGQVVIPNSESAISDQKEKVSTPMLNTVGIGSQWSTGDKTFAYAKANYFKFSNIPTSVSTTSVVNGNTSADTRISETERSFKYEYYGIDADLFFKRRVYKSSYLIGGASFAENQGAPSGINQARRFGGGVGFDVLPNHEVELSGYSYRIESDAALAAYANSDYFFVNRNGFELIAAWKSVKQNFRVAFYYNDSRLIVENPALSDGKMYILRFEVLNVDI